MSLFQTSVINQYIESISKDELAVSWKSFQTFFLNYQRQQNIIAQKEEQFQEGFLRELFVNILGYTINPDPHFNLTTELKNEKNAKKVDGAIIKDDIVIAVIELKSTKTTDLNKIEEQAFSYKNNQSNCRYVITSNFQKIRLYIDNAIEHREWDLFKTNVEDFAELYLLLKKDSILNGLPLKIKEDSISAEEKITKEFYKEYSSFRTSLFQNIITLNPEYEKILVFKKTQKLLDRFLFLFFAEDRLLVPANSVRGILNQWQELKDKYDEYQPLYERFKKYFGYLDKGYQGKLHDIFAYNGGLFESDEILDKIKIDDSTLYQATLTLSNYNYNSDIDVNILGHIFEHSLTEIEEIEKQLDDGEKNIPHKISKRRKDGVFYTPKYITKYMVEKTVGELCKIKIAELKINEEEYFPGQKKEKRRKLLLNLNDYRQWLLQITILDPACGSGAFLNQALEFLIEEHKWINELEAKLTGSAIIFDLENSILENNLFGVDINEESVEIAKLSLWLRTAQKGRKLTTLNNNIKCGNSLIEDKHIAGNKAFLWSNEFPQISNKGGFDIVIGNPPYGINLKENEIDYYNNHFPLTSYKTNLYILFIERMFQLFTQTKVSFIIPKSLLFNSYYEKIREHLLINSNVVELFAITEKVFVDAEVGGSLILTFDIKKSAKKNNKVKLISTNSFYDYPSNAVETTQNQDYFLTIPNKEITIITNDQLSIKQKLLKLKCIEDYFELKNGLNTGNIKHILINPKKYGDTYKPIIWGKDIQPFLIKWSGDYINYDESIRDKITLSDTKSKAGMQSQNKIDFALRSKEIFETKKIIVRKTGDRLISALDETDNYYFDTLAHGIYSTSNSFSLESLTMILNSKVATSFYRMLHDIKGKVFAKISLDNLGTFPIPLIRDESDKILFDYHTKIKQRFKILSEIESSFLSLVNNKYKVTFSTNILFKEFSILIKYLQKANVSLSLSEQSEWLSYYESEKKKAIMISEEIIELENKVNLFVCNLYGLSDEEISLLKL